MGGMERGGVTKVTHIVYLFSYTGTGGYWRNCLFACHVYCYMYEIILSDL